MFFFFFLEVAKNEPYGIVWSLPFSWSIHHYKGNEDKGTDAWELKVRIDII